MSSVTILNRCAFIGEISLKKLNKTAQFTGACLKRQASSTCNGICIGHRLLSKLPDLTEAFQSAKAVQAVVGHFSEQIPRADIEQ